jgi:hypothetical protein
MGVTAECPKVLGNDKLGDVRVAFGGGGPG